MLDWNEFFWGTLELTNPTYPYSTVQYWPDWFRDSLTSMHVLRNAEPANHVWCPDCCHSHLEPVIPLADPDGTMRFYISCPEQLRVELTPEDRMQWTIDAGAVATQLATAMGLTGHCKCLVSSRLWRLGRVDWQGHSRDVLFARGLTWKNRRRTIQCICHATRPIVFVSRRLPSRKIWPGRIPPVIALSQVAIVGDGRLELDRDAIFSAVREVDDAAARPPETLSVQQLKVIVRQQVNAEEKSALFDDACIAAYRSEGSYRKAALLLSQEMGRPVSKDQIAQAMKRNGGLVAVLRSGPRSEAKTVRGKSG